MMTPADLRRAVRHLRAVDPVLGRLIRDVGPCGYRVDRGGGPFAALAEAIVYQQLAGAAAAGHRRAVRPRAAERRPLPPEDRLSARPGGAGPGRVAPPPSPAALR